MLWKTYLCSCLLLVLFSVSSVFGQIGSNEGTEFWVVFPTHVPDFDKSFKPLPANISVFISSKQGSSGTVTSGGFTQKFQVGANTVVEIKVPRASAYINDNEANTVLTNRAIHIQVDPGQPKVVAYAHIFAGQRSAASLILPKEALGKKYLSLNYPQFDNEGQNYITVVATEPNTWIHLKKGTTELVPGGIFLPAVNDVYEYLSNDDLSGVTVTVDTSNSGCKRFAAFAGSSAIIVSTTGCDPHSIDPLFQQCYPVENWGNAYGFIPFSTFSPNFKHPVRTAGQFIRVLAKDDGTQVFIDGNPVATLSAGAYFTSPKPLQQPSYITSNKPICVAQYALTQSCSNNDGSDSTSYSDPDMVYLNPISYNIKDITVYSSTRENITEQYLNILIKTTAAASFRINNQKPRSPFVVFPPLPGYSYLQLNLNKDSTNTFHLFADDGFNAIAYGFGNVESYAYSAGTNLAKTVAITGIDASSGNGIDSACLNGQYYFKLTLPYKASSISWKMDDDANPVLMQSPAPQIVNLDNTQTFSYQFSPPTAYAQSGIHHITAAANYTSNGCSAGQQTTDYLFKVIPIPQVTFTKQRQDCLNVIQFSDQSVLPNSKASSRLWNFGDSKASTAENTSILPNPVHRYIDTGIYHVTLTVSSQEGCQSTLTDTIHITAKIQSAVTARGPFCVRQAITFTDASLILNYKVGMRKWIYGDGDTLITSENQTSTQHRFKKAGMYTMKLLVASGAGCPSDTAFMDIKVNDLPSPAFQLPGICLTDQFAHFKNQTPFNGGQAKFLWHFGDTFATKDNPDTSSAFSPVHRYSAAKQYPVSLTVITPDGCDSTLTQTLTVNGIIPKADFGFVNGNRICSGLPIVLKDRSSVVDFGSVTKLEWYFDAVNKPMEKITFDTLSATGTYTYTYPKFYKGPDSIQYTIKLIAYSGTACADSVKKQVTVYPLPRLQFDSLQSVCLSSAKVQLSQGRETTGLPGKGYYAGKGVEQSFFFNPASAGPGTHLLTYTFTSFPLGYGDSVRRSIQVVNDPIVQGTEIMIFEGQTILLKPQYAGSISSYRWYPSTALSSDTLATPLAAPTENTNYTITVSNGICNEVATVQVIVLKPISVPNSFTPNGDGINDLWKIENLTDYPGAIVQIFNRYGMRIFFSTGYTTAWDGRFSGADVPVGTYYYIVDPKNGLKPLSGYVTVLR